MAPLLFFFSITSCFKLRRCSTARHGAVHLPDQYSPFISPSCRSGCGIRQIIPWQGCRWLCAEAEAPGQKTTLPLSACTNPGWTTSCSRSFEPLLSPGETRAALPVARNETLGKIIIKSFCRILNSFKSLGKRKQRLMM